MDISSIKPYEKNAKIVKCSNCGVEVERYRKKVRIICSKCAKKRVYELYKINSIDKIKKSKEYRILNKLKIKEYRRLKYLEEREKVLLRASEYYKKNKDNILLKTKKYRKDNLDKTLIRNANRYHLLRTLKLKSDISTNYLFELKNKSITCPICNLAYISKSDKHLDHIVPISIGGEHVKKNVRVICKKCNLSRPKDGRDL